MKKKISKKAIIIAVSVVVAVLIVVFAVVIPFMKSRREQAMNNIAWTAKQIFVYPSLDEGALSSRKTELNDIRATAWKEAEFIKQGVAAIKDFDFDPTSLSYSFFKVKQQQLMLEQLGYESAELKNAYDAMLRDAIDNYGSAFGFDRIAREVLEGPITEKETYSRGLSYYTDPQSILLKEYAPAYLQEKSKEVMESKDTRDVLNLCADLASVSAYTDVRQYADVDAIIRCLTADAQQITVRQGEGYYGDRTDEAGSDFESDELWSQYLPGNYTHSNVNSVQYYGDLASTYFVSQGNLSYTDSEGNKQSETYVEHESRKIYLKGELISEGSIENVYLNAAREDGMVSYHKDGFCFAIGDREIVCFVGPGFLLVFA